MMMMMMTIIYYKMTNQCKKKWPMIIIWFDFICIGYWNFFFLVRLIYINISLSLCQQWWWWLCVCVCGNSDNKKFLSSKTKTSHVIVIWIVLWIYENILDKQNLKKNKVTSVATMCCCNWLAKKKKKLSWIIAIIINIESKIK